ncbi:MAG: hypothetical protein WC626_14260 [Methanoregula sp.]
MHPDQITKAKWSVLWYFIENTSAMYFDPNFVRKGIVLPDKRTGKPRFYSYPARIAKDFEKNIPDSSRYHSDISKTWAMRICKDLESLGILGVDNFVAARQNHETEHYYLRDGTEPFIAVMKIFTEQVTDSHHVSGLYSMEYIQNHINEDLVCEILSRKGAEMRRMLPLWDWIPHESEKMYPFFVPQKSNIQKRESPAENSSIIPVESYAEYFRRMIQELDLKKRVSSRGRSYSVCLRLPVMSPGLTSGEKTDLLKSFNKKTFEGSPCLETYRSAIEEHYQRYQRDRWIIPLLALIRASPKALKEFLFGEWKPYGIEGECLCYSEGGSYCMNYPMFTFLFTTINDISRSRLVPSERRIPYVRFRPDIRIPEKNISRPALFMIDTNSGFSVCFDASFDTERVYYGAENGDVWENDNEQNYDLTVWLDLRFRWQAITAKDIPDMDAFIGALQDRRSRVSQYLLSKLSHRLQHIVLFKSEPLDEGSPIHGLLLDEINRILIQPGFFNKDVFSSTRLSDAGKAIGEKTGFCREGLEDAYYPSSVLGLNRILLEDSYPGLLLPSDASKKDREWLIMNKIENRDEK